MQSHRSQAHPLSVLVLFTLLASARLVFAQAISLQDENLRFELQVCSATSPTHCAHQIDAIGLFSKYSAQDLRHTLDKIPRDGRAIQIHFSSLGGNLAGGLQVGQLLREYQIKTQTGFKESVCYSACAYAFMGGSIRELGPQARLGLHQFYSQTDAIDASQAQSISATISQYLEWMGIDRQALQLALATQAHRMTVLSLAQARQLKIDNAQRPYQAWRLEVTDSGHMATMVSERQANRPAVVTLMIAASGKGYRLLVQISQQSPSARQALVSFAQDNPSVHWGTISPDRVLQALGPWQIPQGGIVQRWFNLDPRMIREWLNHESPSLSVWIHHSEDKLKTWQLRSETRFGKASLEKHLQALLKSQ